MKAREWAEAIKGCPMDGCQIFKDGKSIGTANDIIADLEALESFCLGLEGVNDGIREKLAAVEGDARTQANIDGEAWEDMKARAEASEKKLTEARKYISKALDDYEENGVTTGWKWMRGEIEAALAEKESTK